VSIERWLRVVIWAVGWVLFWVAVLVG